MGKSTIRLRVSKGKLYEAKVGVLEEAKQANERAGKELLLLFITVKPLNLISLYDRNSPLAAA